MDWQLIIILIVAGIISLGSLFIRSKYGDQATKKEETVVKKHAGSSYKCVNCGASVGSDARFCPYCGMEKKNGNVEIKHAENVIVNERPSLLQHIISERERTKQERLEKEARENRMYMIVMIIGLFGFGMFVIIMKLIYK